MIAYGRPIPDRAGLRRASHQLFSTMTAPIQPRVRPVVLVILDGFGCREDAPDNAISRANMPRWRELLARYPNTAIDASEFHVGLPEGQMGNSEVGHLN